MSRGHDGPRLPPNVQDYEHLAREIMHPSAWAYYSAGAGDEVTLRREREAFDRLRLVPRVLRGVDRADTSTAVLGTPVQAPIMFAPTGVQGLAHPEGECATARGQEKPEPSWPSARSPRGGSKTSLRRPRARCGSSSTSTRALR